MPMTIANYFAICLTFWFVYLTLHAFVHLGVKRQPAHSHLSHVELTEGKTGGQIGAALLADPFLPLFYSSNVANACGVRPDFPNSAKRGEMSRRSTPYAFHDGSVGLYFMAFCATQAPFRERMQNMSAFPITLLPLSCFRLFLSVFF
jgi:deferrochelatase/peroxidase EfeB